MDVAYVSALSALLGSVVGGLISGISTWNSQRLLAKSALIGQDRLRHHDLYRDFIVQASRVYVDALMHDEPQIPDLVGLYALISRMRILSSPRLVACAEQIANAATDYYFVPNKTIAEIHEMIKQGADFDPMKEFSHIAREELQLTDSL